MVHEPLLYVWSATGPLLLVCLLSPPIRSSDWPSITHPEC
jgi:hypothetical protein